LTRHPQHGLQSATSDEHVTERKQQQKDPLQCMYDMSEDGSYIRDAIVALVGCARHLPSLPTRDVRGVCVSWIH
jgi:hypothetical protein